MSQRDRAIMEEALSFEEAQLLFTTRRRRTWIGLALLVCLIVGGGAYGAHRILTTRTSADNQLTQAIEAQAKGETRAAVIALRNFLKAEPNHGEARWMLAQALMREGESAAALKEVRAAKALGVTDTTALEVRALLAEGQHEQVLARLESVADVESDAGLLAARGQAALAAGQIALAERSFSRALELPTKTTPQELAAHKGIAQLATLRGDYRGTLTQVSLALKASPNDVEALSLAGEAHLSLGEHADASEAFEKIARTGRLGPLAGIGLTRIHLAKSELVPARALIAQLRKKFPDSPAVQYWHAVVARAEGQFDVAHTAYQFVLGRFPNHLEALLGLGSLHYERKQFEQAQPVLARLLRIAPQHLATRKLLAATYLALNQSEAAAQTLTSVPHGTQVDAQTLALLGNAHIQSGRADQGLATLEEAARLAPENAGVQTQLAVGALSRGQVSRGLASLQSAVSLDPASVQAETLLVMAQLRQGKPQAAIEAAKNFVAARPKSPLAHNLLGGAYQFANDFDQARDAFEQAIALAPEFTTAQLNLARLDRAQGQPAAAKARFETILQRSPDHPVASIRLALMALEEDRDDEALAALERVRTLHPKSLEVRLILSAQYLQAGKSQASLGAAQEAIALDATSPPALLTLGRAQLATGETHVAIDTFAKLSQLQPNSIEAKLSLSAAYTKAGRSTEAKKTLAVALKLNPSHIPTQVALIDVARQAGDTTGAMQRARALQQSNPDLAVGFALEGAIHRAGEQLDAARSAYEQALKREQNAKLTIALADVYRASGNKAGYEQTLASWTSDHPNDPIIERYVAMQAHRSGEQEHARTRYEALLEKRPDDLAALNNLAWLYEKFDAERALVLAKRALALAPDHPAILDTYGWMLLRAGHIQQAVTALQRSVRLDPNVAEHQYHYAQALAEAGDPSRAREALKQALRADDFPGRSDALALRDRLN